MKTKNYKWDGIIDRFWKRIDKSGGDDACWNWVSNSKNRNGYGVLFVNGSKIFAHRFSFILATGMNITKDQYVCHHCDNPACCNPTHLFLGSHSDNMKDAAKKCRLPLQISRRKLCIDEVVELKKLSKEGKSIRSLAVKYSLDRKTVRLILTGKTYAETIIPGV